MIPNVSQIDFSPLHMRAELVCAPWLNWRIELGEWRHFGTSACGTGFVWLSLLTNEITDTSATREYQRNA